MNNIEITDEGAVKASVIVRDKILGALLAIALAVVSSFVTVTVTQAENVVKIKTNTERIDAIESRFNDIEQVLQELHRSMGRVEGKQDAILEKVGQ